MKDPADAWEEMTPSELRHLIVKWIAIAIAMVMGLSILGFITGVISLPFRSARGVLEKTLTPDAIIGNYQWYYDQYNAIQAQKANLTTLEKTARERPGLLMVLNSMIGDYNSRSNQINRNLWKATDLPYQMAMEDGK